jgi:signal transduction histidine kinase
MALAGLGSERTTSFSLSMRWWLAAAFAAVAALTAAVAVHTVSDRSERSFRRNAEALAVGNAVSAAEEIKAHGTSFASLRASARAAGRRRALTLYVIGRTGRTLASQARDGRSRSSIPHAGAAAAEALRGGRFIDSNAHTGEVVVAVPIRGTAGRALLAYTRRPELRTQLGVVRNAVFRSAVWATTLGAGAGLVIATLITLRLRRIARAATRIADGDFERPVGRDFPDEVGSLGSSIDSMRSRLGELFEAVEQDRARLRRLLERLHEGVLVVERGLKFQYVNRRARELLDVEALVCDWGDAPPEVGEIRAFGASAFTAAGVEQRRVETHDGRVLLLSAIPPTKSHDAVILVVADETERDRAERAQRDFATNAAHQLRTPVAAIVSSIEMLQTGAKDDRNMRDSFLDAIEEQADRLTRLTRALLTLARVDAEQEGLRPGRVAIESLLERVTRTFPRRHDGTLDVRADAVDAWADPDVLEQALLAILDNADKYAPDGPVEVRAARVGERVAIAISDSGPGMSASQTAYVFERFYRGKDDRDGFGLGLAIARQAIVALDGTIHVASTPGRGTTVRVELPAYSGALVA